MDFFMRNKRILIIDDDREIWQTYQAVLALDRSDPESSYQKMVELFAKEGGTPASDAMIFDLSFASQGRQGYEAVKDSLDKDLPFAIAFIDVRMPPGWDGMETAVRIRRIDPDIEIVIITAFSDRSCYEIVQEVGAPDKLLFFRKPFDPEELMQTALSLTEKWNLGQQEKAANAALLASEERFRALVETTSDYVWEVDVEGRFTYCSPVCEMIYGYRPEELLGKRLFDVLLPSEDGARFEEFFNRSVRDIHGFYAVERRSLNKNGEEIYIESSATPIINEDEGRKITGFRGIDRDVTERKLIEKERALLVEQNRQSQKMEALGSLAGGIAHDLNNVLTPILGYAQICTFQVDPDHPIYEYLKLIQQSGEKAAALIRQILTFSRKQLLVLRPLDLNKLIIDFSKILRRMIREDIELILDLDEDLGIVDADSGQMEQVLINLVVNARDAIEKDGQVVIRTRNEDMAKGELIDCEGRLVAGSYVVLTVKDNGMGIDETTLGNIFDPFYTTKEVDKGTGMGLASVYGIVKQHAGHILVDTTPGKGSTFNIYLKRTRQQAVVPADREKAPGSKGGHETIFLVEDDVDVRTVTKAALEHFGYRVVTAADGNEAIRILSECNGKVDLLITDIVMPGLGGKALAESLLEKEPALPVIFISGYTSEVGVKEMVEFDECHSFIQKPFQIIDLAQKIREMLDQCPNGKAGK
jgi:PAS domain S-box-containing protein